jgi:hypothetical protein
VRSTTSAFVVLSLTAVPMAASCVEPVRFPVTPREPGVRAPRTAACDASDPMHCLLPWPSSTFLRADPSTETGVRVEMDVSSLDAGDALGAWSADGFSRATSVLTAFPSYIDETALGGPTGGVLRLFVATPGHPRYGEEVPLRIEAIEAYRNGAQALLIGDPLALLEPATDYVAVVTDDLRDDDGMPLEAERATRVALGLEPPASTDEAALAGYHAPTAALLDEVGLDPARVLRAWDFTTRSEEDPRRFLLAVRDASLEALSRGEVRFEIDEVRHRDTGPIATIVRGRMTGLPDFVGEDGELALGADGMPRRVGDDTSPFRVMIPRGGGDYHTVLFGHGAGGSADDGTFDDDLASQGVAKVGIELTGFHGDVLLDTIVGLGRNFQIGLRRAASPLLQAMAQAVVVERALGGELGAILSAETLGGMPNPNAGRRPGLDGVTWVGGSLGGITGLVITSIDPDIRQAVLNVPACGWSQWVRDSLFYLIAAEGIRRRNGGELGAALTLAIGQTQIDFIDGASFVGMGRDDGDVLLIQESMGDEVVPNAGTELVAIVAGASMVGAPLSRIVGVPEAGREARGTSVITQFRAETADIGDVHGFAASGNPSGRAAQDQIRGFLESTWAGAPVVRVPDACPDGRCDFRR